MERLSVGASVMQVRFNDTATAVTVQPDGQIGIDGTLFTVETIVPGVYVVGDGQRRWTVAVAGAADDRWISVDGQVYRMEVVAEGRARKKGLRGGDETLMAPMPATVVKVLVEPGASVTEGDTVIVLEAMKMELAIRAPRQGIVGAVRCAVGELVQPGVALLEIT